MRRTMRFICFSVAGGDMRKATTFLQSLHRLNSEEISPTEVMDVAALCDNDRIASIIKAASEITFDKLIIKIRELLLVRFCYICCSNIILI